MASGASNSTPNAATARVRRDGESAEGECRTIDHHSDEQDCDHDEGALGRNLRPPTAQDKTPQRPGPLAVAFFRWRVPEAPSGRTPGGVLVSSMTGPQRIYRSANGDRWLLAHDPNTGTPAPDWNAGVGVPRGPATSMASIWNERPKRHIIPKIRLLSGGSFKRPSFLATSIVRREHAWNRQWIF
jgi:hypothetical protein